MRGNLNKLTAADIIRLIQDQPAEAPQFGGLRPAAVLAPLVWEDGWRLLFTRRAETLSSHKGQVSFPGGAIDPTDPSPEQAAVREAHEEIGLLPGDVRILGRLAYLQTVSNYLVIPVLGLIRWPYTFSLSPREVSRVFTIPLAWLADARNWEERQYLSPKGHFEPVIFFKPYDGELLWGASARITVELLRVLNRVE